MNLMKLYKSAAVVFFLGAVGLSVLWGIPASACSSLGPDKHVGLVKEVQIEKGILMLIDAESGKPIAFSASPDLLQKVNAQEKAIVTFKMDGAKMVAQKIEPVAKG